MRFSSGQVRETGGGERCSTSTPSSVASNSEDRWLVGFDGGRESF